MNKTEQSPRLTFITTLVSLPGYSILFCLWALVIVSFMFLLVTWLEASTRVLDSTESYDLTPLVLTFNSVTLNNISVTLAQTIALVIGLVLVGLFWFFVAHLTSRFVRYIGLKTSVAPWRIKLYGTVVGYALVTTGALIFTPSFGSVVALSSAVLSVVAITSFWLEHLIVSKISTTDINK